MSDSRTTIGVGGPRLSQLDAFAKEGASAFVVKDGKLESSAGMAFSSGLHRMFGAEKSSEAVSANKNTLNFVLGHVYDSLKAANSEHADAIFAKVLKGGTKLPGDSQPISVAERFGRGTYVSSELIRQITTIARHELQETQTRERVRAENFQKYGPANKAIVQDFFGHEPDFEQVGLLDTAKIRLSQFATRVMGDTKPGFMKAIEEMYSDAMKKGPPEMRGAWDVFKEFWLNDSEMPNGDRDEILARLELRVRVAAGNAAAEGKTIDADKLKEVVKQELCKPEFFAPFVDIANQRMIENLSVEDLADVIRAWGKQNKDPEISQQDCDWLAYEIEEAMEEKRLIELKQDKGLVGSLLHMFRGAYSSTYGDARNPGVLLDKITEEMLSQHGKVSNPIIGTTPRERLTLIERNVKDPYKLVQATLHPKPYTKQDLAGLIGESMKPVLKQHHQEMLVVNREEIQQRDNHRKALDRALDPFLRLDSAKNRLSDIEYDKLNQPTTASDFVKSVMMDTVTGAEIRKQKEELDEQYDVTPETTTEERNRIFDTTDYGERLVELNRAVIFNTETAEKSIMDGVLPVMDDFTAFYEEMKALQNQEGGLKSADPGKLLALDLKARDLRERAPQLSEHAVNLLQKYGTEGGDGMGPVREFCLGMHYAADRIMAATSTYMKEAGSRERLHQHDMAELEKLNREVQEIGVRITTYLEELAKLDLAPKVPWARAELQSAVRLLPELGEHLSTLDGQTDPLLANARSVEDLMEPLLGRPLMSRLFGEEMDNALKTEHHIQQAHSIAQSRADVIGQQIDKMLKPSIREIDSFLELQGEIADLAREYPKGGIPQEAQGRISNALDRAETAARQLREHLTTLEERYGGGKEVAIPLLREVATRVETLAGQARETLAQLSKLGGEGGSDTGSSTVSQTGAKKSTNPFDDDDLPQMTVQTQPPKTEPKTEPPKTEAKRSTNPFDDGWEPPKSQTTRTEGPKSTNPFDDDWQPPTSEPPKPRSGGQTKSTNPFDD